jgi:hypothetical protein
MLELAQDYCEFDIVDVNKILLIIR